MSRQFLTPPVCGGPMLQKELVCALVPFPVYRYAAARATWLSSNHFSTFSSKSNAAESVRASGKGHWCWEKGKKRPAWCKALAPD